MQRYKIILILQRKEQKKISRNVKSSSFSTKPKPLAKQKRLVSKDTNRLLSVFRQILYSGQNCGLFIKDLYVDTGKEKMPFLALIAQLIRHGVEVRLIHAKEPGPNFREDFDKYPVLYDRLERVLCPRVHFKMLVFDGKEVYVGSANLTGAGIGLKNDNKRNFESGILTDDPEIVEQAMNQFDEVWIGKHCKTCKRRDFCADPVV